VPYKTAHPQSKNQKICDTPISKITMKMKATEIKNTSPKKKYENKSPST